MRHQGRWLVDGGVFNNLPVDAVRGMGADRVLGVDVPSCFTLALPEREPDGPLLRRLWSLANGGLDWRQPFLVAQASLGMTAGLVNRTRLALCPPDLLLQIELPNVGVLASDRSAQVVQAGRNAAQAHARELAALARPLPPRWWRRLSRLARRVGRAWTVLRGEEDLLYPSPCLPSSGHPVPDPCRLRADLSQAGVCSEIEKGANHGNDSE